jgi:hypothetical protein
MQAALPHLIPGSDFPAASLNKAAEKEDDPRGKLIVALDVSTAAAAQKIVAAVGDSALTYKVGMQLYTAEGPQVVRDLVASGRRVFLDLKYHDIPNTVAAAVPKRRKLGVSMLTVHARGSQPRCCALPGCGAGRKSRGFWCWGSPCSPAWTKVISSRSEFEERCG